MRLEGFKWRQQEGLGVVSPTLLASLGRPQLTRLKHYTELCSDSQELASLWLISEQMRYSLTLDGRITAGVSWQGHLTLTFNMIRDDSSSENSPRPQMSYGSFCEKSHKPQV